MRFWATTGLLLLLAVAALAGPSGQVPPEERLPNVTNYRQMVGELRADAARSSSVRLVSLGRTLEHRDVWMVRLADSVTESTQTVRIVVLCRQHGDEPASTESVLSLVHRLAINHDPALCANLKRVTFYLVPMVNPDGAEAMTRDNGAGADLNRDWGVFSQPETRAVVRAVEMIRPHLIVDAHNWDGDDSYNAHCIEVARTLGVKTTALGEAGLELQRDTVAQLALSGYQVQATAYGPNADTRLAHRYFAHQGRLSFLVETHSGDPRDVADFQQRQGMYTALIHGLARRYGRTSPAQRVALERLERGLSGSTEDARLFPLRAVRQTDGRSPHATWLWFGVLCLYAFALWAAGQGRRSPTEIAIPAGGRHSSCRPVARRYYG